MHDQDYPPPVTALFTAEEIERQKVLANELRRCYYADMLCFETGKTPQANEYRKKSFWLMQKKG